MLIKLNEELRAGEPPVLEKILLSADGGTGADASRRSAFAYSDRIILRARVPRRIGAVELSLRVSADGAPRREMAFSFEKSERGGDVYRLELWMSSLCGEARDGLFFLELLFFRGSDVLYSDTVNNVDLKLSQKPANPCRLLVYRDDFDTPHWMGSRIIYHIFVDRYMNGRGKISISDTQVIEDNWENGVPQHAARPGDDVSNNVFFGGNLWGIIEKLDVIASLGVGMIYLSPVFKAYSNHRYDTGDYEKIDGLLGGEEAFDELILRAGEYGIKLILDGVFNHTGDDSRYFDRYGRYGGKGAYSSPDSPYFKWFRFRKYPDAYESWWDIKILPRLNPACRECREYFAGAGGIGASYVQRGIGGWRLDVADELSDKFLDQLRASVKSASGGDAVIIGEVWENAADKVAYGHRRRYLRGDQLDSVMNYPVREAIINFVLYRDGAMLYNKLTEIYSSYPPCVCRVLMNLLGTHDTERILTVLADAGTENMTNAELASFRLSPADYALARRRLMLASVIQYTVYGIPSLYYGDEAGIEGGRDPFCRMPYPWGREDELLLAHYRRLGKIRAGEAALDGGEFGFLSHTGAFVSYERRRGEEVLYIAANSGEEKHHFALPYQCACRELMSGRFFSEGEKITVPPLDALILKPCRDR